MNWFEIAQFVFYAAWLLALLALLFLIWRSSETRLKHIQNMETTIFDVATKDAESARKSAEATQILVESVHVLVAMIQKDQRNEPE